MADEEHSRAIAEFERRSFHAALDRLFGPVPRVEVNEDACPFPSSTSLPWSTLKDDERQEYWRLLQGRLKMESWRENEVLVRWEGTDIRFLNREERREFEAVMTAFSSTGGPSWVQDVVRWFLRHKP